MKLSKESNESLNKIRAKVTRKDIDFNQQELLYLDEVYAEITKLSTGKAQVISRGCSSCINNAVNIVYNFVTYHEEKHELEEKNTPKITEKVVKEWGTDNTYHTAIKTRTELIKECKEKSIKIPRNATVKQLIQLLDGKA